MKYLFLTKKNYATFQVDRLYGWKTIRNAPILKTMKQQSKDVQNEFNMRLIQVIYIIHFFSCNLLLSQLNMNFDWMYVFGQQIITQFKEQGLNTELYYKNKEMGETFSIVPTSAVT